MKRYPIYSPDGLTFEWSDQVYREDEDEVPAWATQRADRGLCAVIDRWCITHGQAATMAHAMAQPGQNQD